MLTLHRRLQPALDAMVFGSDGGDKRQWTIEGWPEDPEQSLTACAVVLQAVYRLDRSVLGAETAYGTLAFSPLLPRAWQHHFRIEPDERIGLDSVPVCGLAGSHVAMFMPGGEPWWCARGAALAGILTRVLNLLAARDQGCIWATPGHGTTPGEPWAPLIVDLRDILDRVLDGRRPLAPAPARGARRRMVSPDQLGLGL